MELREVAEAFRRPKPGNRLQQNKLYPLVLKRFHQPGIFGLVVQGVIGLSRRENSLGGASDRKERQLALLWVLNQSDGTRSLLDIAERAGHPFHLIRDAADSLLLHELLAVEVAE